MSNSNPVPFETTHFVRDTCLCLHMQRAARALARRFDEALRPAEITNGQFSLMMALNRPNPPRMGEVAALLVLDRTTLTANLKPLERRGLVFTLVDPADRRSRRLALTDAGRDRLAAAIPLWQAEHEKCETELDFGSARLRQDLAALS